MLGFAEAMAACPDIKQLITCIEIGCMGLSSSLHVLMADAGNHYQPLQAILCVAEDWVQEADAEVVSPGQLR